MSTESAQSQDPPAVPDTRMSVLTEVSNAMVALYKAQFGRGPVKTRTHWSGEDILSVVLEGTLTPAERHLIRLGEHQRVREARMFFQYSSVKAFCAPIERLTGRKVRSFLSSTDTDVDGLSVEMFVLHPEGYDGPSRAEA